MRSQRTLFFLLVVILLVSVVIEYFWLGAYQTSAQEIVPSTGPQLFRTRPFILIAAYSFAIFLGARLILARENNKIYYWALIAIGLVAGIIAANPRPGFAHFLSQPMHLALIGIATSPLGLSIHLSSILVALGLIGVIRHKLAE